MRRFGRRIADGVAGCRRGEGRRRGLGAVRVADRRRGQKIILGGMRSGTVLLPLLCAIVAAAPGYALRPEFSNKETRAIMHGYAKCIVDRYRRKASEALLRNVDNRTFMREYPM